MARARRGNEDFEVDEGDFLRHVASVLPAEAEPGSLHELQASDLYFAYACSIGDRKALALFEQDFGADIETAVMRSPKLGVSAAEFHQRLRNKLFVAEPGARPKIATYSGRGELRGWVRVTVLRLITDEARRQRNDREVSVAAEALSAVPSPERDPELDYFQRSYRVQFEASLADAFARLTPRQRNLLRQHILHRLNIDQIGALYGVHRSTAFRWIERARQALLVHTREILRERLNVASGEFTSLMRVAQSQMVVSVRRLFASRLEDEVELKPM